MFFNFRGFYDKIIDLVKQLLCFLTRRSAHEGPDEFDAPVIKSSFHKIAPISSTSIDQNGTAHRYSNSALCNSSMSWNDSWEESDSCLKQVTVQCDANSHISNYRRNLIASEDSEAPEPDYFSQMAPKVTNNPKIVRSNMHAVREQTGIHGHQYSNDGSWYYSTGVSAGDLDDWKDDSSSSIAGWGGDEDGSLDDILNLAEEGLKEQKRLQIQKRIQQHHERNLRKQLEKNSPIAKQNSKPLIHS